MQEPSPLQSRQLIGRRRLLVLLCAGSFLPATGCIQFAANMIHAAKGTDFPAEYDGLKKQTVALYTLTDTSQYTDDLAARNLTRYVAALLNKEVKEIKLVRETEIENWRDTQGFNDLDPIALGRGVKADKVIVIEMTNLRLRDGQTMYKGRADVTVSVHDVETSSLAFRRALDDFTYPVNAALPITETNEDSFRNYFLETLARRIARHFHGYDVADSFAADAEIAGF